MPNVNAPAGLRPVKHLDGSPYNDASNRYYVPASDGTAIHIGDAVKSAGSADALGVPDVTRAAAGDTIRGVVVGIEPRTDDDLNFRAASTERYVLVADAPDIVFEIQEDGAIAVTAVGNNADIVVGTPNSVVGRSGMQLQSSSVGTATAQLRILGHSQRPDNEVGTNSKLLVLINEHELKSVTGV